MLWGPSPLVSYYGHIKSEEVTLTIQSERTNAIHWAREFLYKTAFLFGRIPKDVREEALWVLRHYPTKFEFNLYYRNRRTA